MNIKLTQFIKTRIICRATSLLEELQETTKTLATKTQQQRDLDAIFARHPNDYAWTEFADLVKALVGYRPVTTSEKRKNFQVLARCTPDTKPVFWIVIKDNAYGLAVLTQGAYCLHPTDRLATLQEAEDFIETLEKMADGALYDWIVRHLGVGTLNSSF